MKFFHEARGIGFIVPDDGGSDVFVCAADLREGGLGGLVPGEHVAFRQVRDPGFTRCRAVQVAVLA